MRAFDVSTTGGAPSPRTAWNRIWRAGWFRCAAVMVIGVLVHAPGLHGQRIWDDHYLALENPFIKSPILVLEAFRHYLFPDAFSTHYRPVQNISYIIDYFFWNTDPYGFHLSNVLLHAASGVLLYLLSKKLLTSLWFRSASLAVRDRIEDRVPALSLAALAIALVWVVHPVHSAAVDYISGRADSLAFFFAAAAWLLCFRARVQKGRMGQATLFAAAALLALLALLSREIACVWIAIFVGHLLFVERKVATHFRMAAIAVCLLLVASYAGFRTLPVGTSAPPPSESEWPAPMRVALMFRALGDYTRLVLLPTNLHMERSVLAPASYKGNPGWRDAGTVEYLSVLGLCALGGLAFACSRSGKGQAARVFGASWFVAGFLPISNLIHLNATVAEHWPYLPSVGVLIFFTGCLLDLPVRYRRASVGFCCLVVIGFSVRTAVRSTDWADEETFYMRTLAAGGSSTRVGVNLAEFYSKKGDVVAAERIFRRVLELNPDYPIARHNLADLLRRQGRIAEAGQLLASSVQAAATAKKEYPSTWRAAVALARMRHADGATDEALKILNQARIDYPETWEVICLQAEIKRRNKQADEALELVTRFARANWWHYAASVALGQLHAERGDAEQAAAAWRDASWLDIRDAGALNLIAKMRARQNRFAEAAQVQRRAVARQPDEPRQHLLLSEILTAMGRAEEARSSAATAERLAMVAGGTPLLP